MANLIKKKVIFSHKSSEVNYNFLLNITVFKKVSFVIIREETGSLENTVLMQIYKMKSF
jgi:hypothetical protein